MVCFADETKGLHQNVAFDSYSPLSDSKQMLERMFTPLIASRLQQALMDSNRTLRTQAIDLSRETFVLYVPATEPPEGYCLLVFVPPWEEAKMPSAWRSAFDRHGIIFVSVSKSGNAADVLGRREPLALLAAYNVPRLYRVNPMGVYIGGFSGGSRVALRLALSYPDVFHGVLLNAGSDPIGNAQIPLPRASLFSRFQQSTRVVYLTGKNDREHLDQDARSRQSLQEWCVDKPMVSTAWGGHEIVDPAALDRALVMLTTPQPNSTNASDSACNARIEREIAAQLHVVEGLLNRGDLSKAQTTLNSLDEHFGGLAAPQSIELAHRLTSSQ
jgi:pimeloyl-ACP methyl ester carboxylesterase